MLLGVDAFIPYPTELWKYKYIVTAETVPETPPKLVSAVPEPVLSSAQPEPETRGIGHVIRT
jgi:hypothetical protein